MAIEICESEFEDAVFITSHLTGLRVGCDQPIDAKLPALAKPGTHKRMTEPAIRDLVRELDYPDRQREPELEVDIEVVDEALLDPWFLRTEAEFALIEDDPSAQILEIRLTGYDEQIWAS